MLNTVRFFNLVLTAGALSAAGLAAAQPASGQTPASAASGQSSSQKARAMSAADRSFVMKAAMGGMAEVEAGRVAQQKASSEDVKQFGAKMVDDHSGANAELAKLAAAKDITPPPGPDAAHLAAKKRLEALSGAAFDREYTRMMVDDHVKTITLFEQESKSGSDPEIKAFATKTLPTLRAHLQMVKQVQSAATPSAAASR